jgi:hypothetical protein
MADVCCGGDLLEWVSPDLSASVFGRLDHPADLVRAAAVSQTWRRFGEQSSPSCYRFIFAVSLSSPICAVIENELSKNLCLRLCPEVATVAAAAEVTRSPPSPSFSESDSKRDYRIYSNLAAALVSGSGKPSVGCVLRCVGASSTDNFPIETIVHTLDEHDVVNFRPSYWSSCGADDPEEPESLTYRLNSDICIVDEIRVLPFMGGLISD